MDDTRRRFLLGCVARREILVDKYGRIWRWVSGELQLEEPETGMAMADLESEGLVALLAGGPDRYWDVTDTALRP